MGFRLNWISGDLSDDTVSRDGCSSLPAVISLQTYRNSDLSYPEPMPIETTHERVVFSPLPFSSASEENVEATGGATACMELTAAVVDEKCRAYPEVQALSTVEEEHVDLLPETFASGDYGWRDAEWVVQWYGRRFLGEIPNADRRAIEDAYDENDYEDVHDAISAAVEADTATEMMSSLTVLAGVDVPIASAFCQFIDPEHYVVVDSRQWATLRELGELDDQYPEPVTVEAYEDYLDTYRAVAERCDCSLWDLYRAIWVIAAEE